MPGAATTTLLLVRHGGTTAGPDYFAGSTDVPLADDGRKQAEALAERLAPVHLDAIYSSDLRRAMQTAEAIVRRQHPGATLRPMRELREIDHGHWENLAIGDVKQRFPDEYVAYEADPFFQAPRGGETGMSVLTRALPAVYDLVAHHEGKRTLIVSHKATLRIVLCGLLGIDPRRYRDRLRQDLACLNIVHFSGAERAQLVLLNDTSHYTAVLA